MSPILLRALFDANHSTTSSSLHRKNVGVAPPLHVLYEACHRQKNPVKVSDIGIHLPSLSRKKMKLLPNGMTRSEMKELRKRDPLRAYVLIFITAFFCA